LPVKCIFLCSWSDIVIVVLLPFSIKKISKIVIQTVVDYKPII
jgi:hypothetical protein